MKRFLVLILALSMFTTIATSEEMDLAKMSLDELQTLRENIDTEIDIRTGRKTDGYSGLFIGGKNIGTGAYLFSCVGEVTISRWKSEREYERAYDPITVSEHADGESVMVSFDDDTHILVEKGIVIIQPATEDWIPKAP